MVFNKKILKKFKSLDLTLNELKSLFTIERERFKNIEVKATAFIALNTIIFMVLMKFISFEKYFVLIPSVIFLSISVVCAYRVFELTKTKIPHKKYGDFMQYAKMDEKNLKAQFCLNYIICLEEESFKADKKLLRLSKTIWFSKISGILLIIGIILLLI